MGEEREEPPVSIALPAATRDPDPHTVSDAKSFLAADPTTASWLKTANITQEQFEKHGTQARELIETVRASR